MDFTQFLTVVCAAIRAKINSAYYCDHVYAAPLSVHLASTGYVSFDALGAHWTQHQQPLLFMHSCRHASIILLRSWRVH